jgi:hypothetical protein
MPSLNSSAISSADYNPSSQTMTITFTSGGSYSFYRVPYSVYHGLISAGSPGSYYHAYIRGRYGP